jgi:hypothetical protein
MKKYRSLLCTALVFMAALSASGQQKFSGTFSNGYKGGRLSFVLSADKKTIKDFTFTGHWRCSGSVESITAGPEKAFPVKSGVVDVVLTEPEGGGASAFRFAIKGTLSGKVASGTFRMSIAGLSCDTYLLNWTAQSK